MHISKPVSTKSTYLHKKMKVVNIQKSCMKILNVYFMLMHVSKHILAVTTYLKRSLQKVHIYIKNSGCKHTKILHGDIEYVHYAKIG